MNPQLLSPSYLFVPPALAALNITPEDCQLVASYNKSSNQDELALITALITVWNYAIKTFSTSVGQYCSIRITRFYHVIRSVLVTSNWTRFTFSVSWSTANHSYREDDKLELSFREPIDESSQVIEDAHSLQAKTRAEEKVRCDGPCGHEYPPEELDALGRCGHFLCEVCHGLVYNEDGTKGCSNFDCVYATLYSYLPEDYARRAYESHILARQRAKERGEASRHSTTQAPPKSCSERKGASACPRRNRPRTPRREARRTSSLTFVNRRGSKKGSPQHFRTPLEDGNKAPALTNKSSHPSPPDRWSRKMRVLDEIFSEMTTVSSTQEGPTSEFELLNIRLMIFEPGPFKTIKRVHISREMSAALTVKEALDELVDRRNGKIRHECPSRLYFCSENTSEGLRRITVEEFESARLWQYPARNSVLHFVLDAVGYLKGKGGD